MLLGSPFSPRPLRLSLALTLLLLVLSLLTLHFKDWARAQANDAFTYGFGRAGDESGKTTPISTYFEPVSSSYNGNLLKDVPKAPPNWNPRSNKTVSSARPSYAPNFPYKLWQTAPDKLSRETWEWIHTWFQHNPSLRHEILNDRAAESFVVSKFAHRPDIVDLYTHLTIKIAKLDILRYLVLIAEGGIYADIDVSCDGRIAEWIPDEYYGRASLLIGQEFDYQWRGEGRELASQLTNWAIMAKPGCKHLQFLVDEIIIFFQDFRRDHNCTYADITVDMLGALGDANIIDTTGPKHMSYAILRSLAQDLGTTMDDRNISDVETPRLIGDVLILPNVAFAAAQADFRTDRGPIRVTHHYMGSWKRPDD